jgi:hypothetical protein
MLEHDPEATMAYLVSQPIAQQYKNVIPPIDYENAAVPAGAVTEPLYISSPEIISHDYIGKLGKIPRKLDWKQWRLRIGFQVEDKSSHEDIAVQSFGVSSQSK